MARSVDGRIQGTGLPLTFERTYNSLNHGYDGDLGHGQKLAFGQRVRVRLSSDGLTATVEGPSGYAAPFAKNADGSWRSPTGIGATLSRASDGTSTLRIHRDGRRYSFHSDGELASLRDQNGNRIALSYTSGRATTITDTQGRGVASQAPGIRADVAPR